MIKIKEPIHSRRALFDIGIAGPLAGFAFVLPLLCLGINSSRLIPKGAFPPGDLSFGEPLIFRCVGALLLGYSPDRQDMIAHPIAMAAWFGLLATSLNLLPIWQLDGGHIAYALFGAGYAKAAGLPYVPSVSPGWDASPRGADFGRVLSEYVDVIVIRANKHKTVLQVAEHSTCFVPTLHAWLCVDPESAPPPMRWRLMNWHGIATSSRRCEPLTPGRCSGRKTNSPSCWTGKHAGRFYGS